MTRRHSKLDSREMRFREPTADHLQPLLAGAASAIVERTM
jgi:hypothetical protein